MALGCKYICAHKDIKLTYCDIADDGGTHKVAILVTLDIDVSAIQKQLSSLIHTTLDQTADSLLGLGRDQRPNICTRLVSWQGPKTTSYKVTYYGTCMM